MIWQGVKCILFPKLSLTLSLIVMSSSSSIPLYSPVVCSSMLRGKNQEMYLIYQIHFCVEKANVKILNLLLNLVVLSNASETLLFSCERLLSAQNKNINLAHCLQSLVEKSELGKNPVAYFTEDSCVNEEVNSALYS